MRSVVVSLLLSIRMSLRERGALQLEILALRHQLHVVKIDLSAPIPHSTIFMLFLGVRCVYSIRSRRALVLVQESAETIATFQRDRLRPGPRR